MDRVIPYITMFNKPALSEGNFFLT